MELSLLWWVGGMEGPGEGLLLSLGGHRGQYRAMVLR